MKIGISYGVFNIPYQNFTARSYYTIKRNGRNEMEISPHVEIGRYIKGKKGRYIAYPNTTFFFIARIFFTTVSLFVVFS